MIAVQNTSYTAILLLSMFQIPLEINWYLNIDVLVWIGYTEWNKFFSHKNQLYFSINSLSFCIILMFVARSILLILNHRKYDVFTCKLFNLQLAFQVVWETLLLLLEMNLMKMIHRRSIPNPLINVSCIQVMFYTSNSHIHLLHFESHEITVWK